MIGSALFYPDQPIGLLSPRGQRWEPIATPEAYPLDIAQMEAAHDRFYEDKDSALERG